LKVRVPENTLVVLVSDNGASGEGGPNGSVNEMKMMQGIPDNVEDNLPMLDDLGSPKTYNHYPNGWAMAFNTPFKMWKRYEFNGGTSDPCLISWPAGMKATGEIRDQYHHAIDIVPTILDILGVEAPKRSRATCKAGSTASACATASTTRAPTARRRSSMLGSRAVWRRLEGREHAPDRQRLEQLQRRRWSSTTPPSTARSCNLADEHPRSELVNLWFMRPVPMGLPAGRPLAARDPDHAAAVSRPLATGMSTSPAPPSARVAGGERSQPVVHDRCAGRHPGPGAEACSSHGSPFGGHALYVKDNRLHYIYNWVGMIQQHVVAAEDIPTGEKLILSASFDKAGEDPPGVAKGRLTLWYDDKRVGEAEIKTQPASS
jgi:arylsulfatase